MIPDTMAHLLKIFWQKHKIAKNYFAKLQTGELSFYLNLSQTLQKWMDLWGQRARINEMV